MEPSDVRRMIVNNYGGVRIDGTNATIIGNEPGEFIADRNNITRVWMDHAFWPFVTTKLYIDQTGDTDVLFEHTTYFKDYQSMRGTSHDEAWNTTYGNKQRTAGGQIYFGTVLEHILIQNLCAFYDVGEHNEMKLHGADWNDALDMAWDKGESVAFTCAYAGNLLDIAKCLRNVEKISGINRIEVLDELKLLLADDEILYNCPDKKQDLLMSYAKACENCTSGSTVLVPIAAICENLEHKAEWMMKNIRENEWISDGTDGGWFNGYYDNNGRPVERCESGDVRMMLTGQVFAMITPHSFLLPRRCPLWAYPIQAAAESLPQYRRSGFRLWHLPPPELHPSWGWFLFSERDSRDHMPLRSIYCLPLFWLFPC